MDDARERWVHEDNLINHRLSWLGVTQGLLFAAYGFVLQERHAPPQSTAGIKQSPVFEYLTSLIPYVGLITSVLVLIGVVAAGLAMIKIKDKYRMETYGISKLTTAMGWSCAGGLPLVFVVAWTLIIRNGSA